MFNSPLFHIKYVNRKGLPTTSERVGCVTVLFAYTNWHSKSICGRVFARQALLHTIIWLWQKRAWVLTECKHSVSYTSTSPTNLPTHRLTHTHCDMVGHNGRDLPCLCATFVRLCNKIRAGLMYWYTILCEGEASLEGRASRTGDWTDASCFTLCSYSGNRNLWPDCVSRSKVSFAG